MARPRDWHPLGDRDPVPGEVDELARLAQRYRDTAQAIRDARDTLDRLSTHESWDSEAGRAFTRRAEGTAGAVGQAHVRYQRAADGLARYVQELREVQDDADALLRRAQQTDDELRGARVRERTAESAAPDSPEAQALDARRSEVAALEAEIARSAWTLRETIVARWQAAGDRAAADLQRISSIDGLADSCWDDFVGAVLTAGEAIGRIAAGLGVLALVCVFIPVLAPFAALLGALAFAGSVLALAGSGLAYAEGRGSGSDVLWNVAGVLTFGAGRAFTGVARTLGLAGAARAKPSYLVFLRGQGSTRSQARDAARRVDWRGTRRIPDGPSLRARAGAVAPWLPRPGELAQGFSQSRVWREAVADSRAFSQVRAGGQLPSRAPDEVLGLLRGLPSEVRAVPEVSAALQGAGYAGAASHGVTVASAYLDLRQLEHPLPPFAAEPLPGGAR